MENNTEKKAEIDTLILKMQDPKEDQAYEYSNKLAEIGGDYVLGKMLELLYHEDNEVVTLASKTLARIDDNQKVIDQLFEAINNKQNSNRNGAMVEALMGFDCSEKFVDVFKIYLFGNVKAQAMAKMILDFEEFDITPRTIRKAEKHWNHYTYNVKQDEAFEEKKEDVEDLLNDLKSLFDEE